MRLARVECEAERIPMPTPSIPLDLSELYWTLPVPMRVVVGKCAGTRVSKEGAARPQ